MREPSEGIENWGLDTNLKRTIDNSCGVFTVFALIVNGLVVPSTNEYPIDHPRPIFDIQSLFSSKHVSFYIPPSIFLIHGVLDPRRWQLDLKKARQGYEY